MPAQFPVPVLLDARGNPFSVSASGAYQSGPPAPAGAYLQDSALGPTLNLVEPGGGIVRLTDQDDMFRAMPYADVQASQAPIAAVVGGMVRRLSIVPRKVYRRPPRGASQNGKPKL